jgi:hypothetical protein
MTEHNPFLGTTRQIPRPTGSEPQYRHQTAHLLMRDQRLWDAADRGSPDPLQGTPIDVRQADLVTRVRLEYLGTAFGSIAEWNRSQDRIIAETLTREARERRTEQIGVYPTRTREIAGTVS